MGPLSKRLCAFRISHSSVTKLEFVFVRTRFLKIGVTIKLDLKFGYKISKGVALCLIKILYKNSEKSIMGEFI